MSRPKLLYVVHRLPYPPDKGDRIRAWNLLEFLAQRFDVYLACIADEPTTNEALDALRSYCRQVAVSRLRDGSRIFGALASLARGRTASEGAFGSRTVRRAIRNWAANTSFDVALAYASSAAQYLTEPKLEHVRKIVDFVDVDSEKWLQYAAASKGARSWLYRTEGRRVRRLEKEISEWAQAITLVSDAEVKLLRSFCPTGTAKAITNGVNLDYFVPWDNQKEVGCVFVGAMDYLPNVDAVCGFCQEVWPTIQQSFGGRLQIVGRRPVRAVRQLQNIRGVEVVGQVPDIRPYLASAAVAVMPLKIARGIQNKVLEAMAMGKAVVASAQALEGLDVVAGEHVMCASTPEDWVDVVGSLLQDESLRLRLGKAGRRFVEEHHSWNHCLEPFASLLGASSDLGVTAPKLRCASGVNLTSQNLDRAALLGARSS